MPIQDYILRLLLSVVIGGLIGGEREAAHRPAGFRTHILVCIGAAIVTAAGQSLALDSGADPTRIAAQVVSGVGFLGAGTILRDGFSIRGLTTAASIWTTACLGIAAGAGLYVLALLGLLTTVLVLTVFDRVILHMPSAYPHRGNFVLHAKSVPAMVEAINAVAEEQEAEVQNLEVLTREASYELRFIMQAKDRKSAFKYMDVVGALSTSPDLISIRCDEG